MFALQQGLLYHVTLYRHLVQGPHSWYCLQIGHRINQNRNGATWGQWQFTPAPPGSYVQGHYIKSTQLFLMNHGVSHGLPSMNLETLLKSSFSFQCLMYLIFFPITSKSRKMALEKQLQLSHCPPCWILETAEGNWEWVFEGRLRLASLAVPYFPHLCLPRLPLIP